MRTRFFKKIREQTIAVSLNLVVISPSKDTLENFSQWDRSTFLTEAKNSIFPSRKIKLKNNLQHFDLFEYFRGQICTFADIKKCISYACFFF